MKDSNMEKKKDVCVSNTYYTAAIDTWIQPSLTKEASPFEDDGWMESE